MQIEYYETPGVRRQLIHFTSKTSVLSSILEHGFLFVHNETGTHRAILDSLGISYPDIERGMISFTEAEWDKSYEIKEKFGYIGIAIDFNWALDMGAKHVAYIPKSGPVFEALKVLVSSGQPSPSHWADFLGDEIKGLAGDMIIQGILSDPALHGNFTTPLHALLLELLHWVEVDDNEYQQEVRIRSQKTFGGLSNMTPFEQVQLLKDLKTNNVFSYNLEIPSESVHFFCCPSHCETEVKAVIDNSKFAGKELRLYPV